MRKAKITKYQILQTAEKFFATKKYHEVLMSEIASELNIAKGSLYNYFPSKEELYLQVIFNRFETFLMILKEKLEKDCNPEENLKTLIRQFYSFMCKYTHFFEIWKQLKTNAYKIQNEKFIQYQKEIKKLFLHILLDGKNKKLFFITSEDFIMDLIIGMLEKAISRGILLDKAQRKAEREKLCFYAVQLLKSEQNKSLLFSHSESLQKKE